jgi:hypothetical protein
MLGLRSKYFGAQAHQHPRKGQPLAGAPAGCGGGPAQPDAARYGLRVSLLSVDGDRRLRRPSGGPRQHHLRSHHDRALPALGALPQGPQGGSKHPCRGGRLGEHSEGHPDWRGPVLHAAACRNLPAARGPRSRCSPPAASPTARWPLASTWRRQRSAVTSPTPTRSWWSTPGARSRARPWRSAGSPPETSRRRTDEALTPDTTLAGRNYLYSGKKSSA